MTCAHFTHVGEDRCAQGVSYMALAGGGAFRMLLRLPCLPRRHVRRRMLAVQLQHHFHDLVIA